MKRLLTFMIAVVLSATAAAAQTGGPPPTLYLTEFAGVDPTGTQSSVMGTVNAFKALNARGGGTLIVPKGTYLIDTTIDCSSTCAQTSNWAIQFEDGASIVAAPALTTSALKIWDGAAGAHTLDIYNANVDMSGATCNADCTRTTGTTAVEVQGQKRVAFYGPQLYGGTSYVNSNANNGITCTKVNTCQVVGGTIGGFANGGMYVSGDLLAHNPTGYKAQVSGVLFEHNSSGVEAKFSLDDLLLTGNRFRFNHIDVGTYTAGSNNSEPPARYIRATGNKHKFTQVNAYQIASSTKGVVAGNEMEDIAYDETGSNPYANAAFINDNGATGLTISNNTMRMKDWSGTGTSIVCILVHGAVYNSVVYTGGGINGGGNTCEGARYGFYESAGVAASTLIDERFNIAANFVTAANAATVVDYYDPNNVFTHTVGGVR